MDTTWKLNQAHLLAVDETPITGCQSSGLAKKNWTISESDADWTIIIIYIACKDFEFLEEVEPLLGMVEAHITLETQMRKQPQGFRNSGRIIDSRINRLGAHLHHKEQHGSQHQHSTYRYTVREGPHRVRQSPRIPIDHDIFTYFSLMSTLFRSIPNHEEASYNIVVPRQSSLQICHQFGRDLERLWNKNRWPQIWFLPCPVLTTFRAQSTSRNLVYPCALHENMRTAFHLITRCRSRGPKMDALVCCRLGWARCTP